jgi:benzoyl-CoA reductase/2-hydroxyglutaryl-CoA dehydratase subunit BcrC/BadD/HgdB
MGLFERVQESSLTKLRGQYMRGHYAAANEAKSAGVPIVFVTATYPAEIVRAFSPDVFMVYPENHAALLNARHLTDDLSAVAEAQVGLTPMDCSYELANIGYLLENRNGKDFGKKIPVLPEPDVLLSCNSQCDVVCHWYDTLQSLVPGSVAQAINVFDRFDGQITPERVAIVKDQILDAIYLLEEKSGTKLDRDKLFDVADKSNQAVRLWRKYLAFGKEQPSPVTSFEGFLNMALIVSERGTQQAIDYYQELVDETQGKVDRGESVLGEERRRLLWDNLAMWHRDGLWDLSDTLESKGYALVGSNYLDVWQRELDTSSFDGLLDSMAAAYCRMYTNLTLGQRIDSWDQMVTDYNADGILFHANRSCITFSRQQEVVAKGVEARQRDKGKKVHGIVFEGDMGRRGIFNPDRLNLLMEQKFEES